MKSKIKKVLRAMPVVGDIIYYWVCKKNKKLFTEILRIKRELEMRGVAFVFCEPPVADKLVGLTSFEKERIQKWTFDFNHISKETERLKKIYGEDTDMSYLEQLYDGAKVVLVDGKKTVCDYESEYVNIVNGHRVTVGQPVTYHNKINIYGPCTVRGTGVEDRHTISSNLQEMVNKEYPDSYAVVNQGIGCGSTVWDDLSRMKRTVLKEGDIVVLCQHINETFLRFCRKNGINCIESSKEFRRPHEYGEWFTDNPVHTNKSGNLGIARCIYKELQRQHFLKKEIICNNSFLLENDDSESDMVNNKEFAAYLESLAQYRTENSEQKKIGSIVMNCNPFTLGHRCLIETAAKQMDVLYIFVVEENKSYFDFKDRYRLVQLGTKDLDNVVVIPSGKFIISALTFPGYFYKDHDNNAIVDTSKDLDLFGKYIAKALNIRYRFAGEEPLDKVTRQYNYAMAERLPLYGIEFIEIPRKEEDSQVISASRVRKCLETKDFETIKKLVPSTTYDYLVKQYS